MYKRIGLYLFLIVIVLACGLTSNILRPPPFDHVVQLLEILSLLIWPAIILYLVGWRYHEPIEELIRRIQKGEGFGVKFEAVERHPNWAKPPEDAAIPDEASVPVELLPLKDIEEAFNRIPDLGETPERRTELLPRARGLFLFNGVFTKQQLDKLVTSNAVLNILRTLYIEELDRDPAVPIDPIAVASHGAFLFTRGTTPEVIENVRQAIRGAPEYQDIKRIEQAGRILLDLQASDEQQIKAAQEIGKYPRKYKSLKLLIRASEIHEYGKVQAEVAEQLGNVATPGDERAINALRALRARTKDPLVHSSVDSALRKLGAE